MKWTEQRSIYSLMTEGPYRIQLMTGLIGLPELTRFEILFKEEEFPFVRINSLDDTSIAFLAADPFPIVKNYLTCIGSEETSSLKLKQPEDALILTLATLVKPCTKITLNLMAPLFIHRASGEGKQVVLENYREFSPRHLIYEGK